ncbi:retrovirus-related pol polyprotein from transposon TNT 1-94 [Tanacetum coccineum]|uniref:Retrovirus-related pol polyprotein from transposon TNT 1-94 n=1 Tax=Tanacetum coccineum TaxID=301880 RepID=A0ABQ5H9N2_9ASTR
MFLLANLRFLNLYLLTKRIPSQSWGSIVSNVPSSSLDECRSFVDHRRISFCGVNEKKYILVIVDDYSRFTWVKCLRSKDEAPDFIIKFLKMIQVRLKVHVQRIRTDNGTEFVNQTLHEYYEKVGISHENIACSSPLQNGDAKAVATACYTQNRSIIRLRYGKTPYEILHDKPPDLLFFYVFGALYYPKNDSENLDFDKLTAMAFEHSSSGPVLYEMTPATIYSGLVPSPPPTSTPFVPPLRTDWDFCFQLIRKINEFECLEVSGTRSSSVKFMVITLNGSIQVNLEELEDVILKNKTRLVARGYHQEEGIDFENLLLQWLDLMLFEFSSLMLLT